MTNVWKQKKVCVEDIHKPVAVMEALVGEGHIMVEEEIDIKSTNVEYIEEDFAIVREEMITVESVSVEEMQTTVEEKLIDYCEEQALVGNESISVEENQTICEDMKTTVADKREAVGEKSLLDEATIKEEKGGFEDPANSEEKRVEKESDNVEDIKTNDKHSTFEDKIANDVATNHHVVLDTFTSNDGQKEENIKVSSEVETEVGDANEEDKMIHDRATYCSETSDTIEEDELLRHNDTNMLAIVGQITKPSSDSSTQILSEGYPELWVTAMVIFISLLWLNC